MSLPPPSRVSPRMPLWITFCFCVSGAAGLLYEVIWSKQLTLVLGSSLQAVAAVVVAFLGGLALGARVLGVPLSRRPDGARIYALLEVGVALFGLLLLPLIRMSEPLVGALYQNLGGQSSAFACARFGLLTLLLLPPAALMGATLPVLVAHAARLRIEAGLAVLYGLNTLGAVLGSLLAGFALIPQIGLSKSTLVAAALNLGVAAIAWTQRKPSAVAGSQPDSSEETEASFVPLDKSSRTIVALVFVASGFGALAFQMAWVRLFGLVLGSSVYSFSAVLGVYLLGIALGSFLIAPWLPRLSSLSGLGLLQMLLAATSALGLHLFPNLPRRTLEVVIATRGDWPRMLVSESTLVATVIGLPCLLLGALFPVGGRLLQTQGSGHAAGFAYALNTVGAIAGSLISSFVLLPALGVQGTHILGIALAAAGAVALLLQARLRHPPHSSAPSLPPVALLSAAITLAALLTAPAWDPASMSVGLYRPSLAQQVQKLDPNSRTAVQKAAQKSEVLLYHEGQNASVLLQRYVANQTISLRIGGKVEASSDGDMQTQTLAGLLPAALALPDSRALVVGHGSGITAAAMLAGGVGSLEIVEMERTVLEASRRFHEPGKDPLDDPRTTTVLQDARAHLLHAPGRYGLIVSEPSNPWMAGVNNLFTVDFYQRVRAKLEPTGVFCQWIQLYEISRETLASLLRSFSEVFPRAQVFCVDYSQDLLLIAAPEDRALDLSRLSTERARQLLTQSRIDDPKHVAVRWACRLDSFASQFQKAELNTDDRPIVEYRAPKDIITTASIQPGKTSEAIALVPFSVDFPADSLLRDWDPLAWYDARIRRFIDSNDFASAGRCVASAKAALPAQGEALRKLETLFEESERYARSLALYEKAVAYVNANRKDLARAAFENAVATDPSHARAWSGLAFFLFQEGDLQGAANALPKARLTKDSEVLANADLIEGMLAAKKQQTEEAVRFFLSAQKNLPSYEEAYLLESKLQRQRKNLAAAREALRRGLDAIPGSANLKASLEALETDEAPPKRPPSAPRVP
ncbi:MAG: hypothetical protein RLZZ244_854 [Verrucomicrobiota bacterium]